MEVPVPKVPKMVRFGRAICGDLREAERREWWLANGVGGYAAGTIAGSLTRRYHGLLIAPVDPPLGRKLVWAKADAELVDGEQSWPLFTNRWGDGVISPAGHVHIEAFHLDGTTPVWLFAKGLIRIETRVWLESGANTAYIGWRLLPGSEQHFRSLSLRVRLMINDRDHHSQMAAGEIDPQLEIDSEGLRVRHSNFTLRFQSRGGTIIIARQWIENFDLPLERQRGLSDRDNHLQVGEARLELVPGQWVGVVGSMENDPSSDLEAGLERRHHYQHCVLDRAARCVPEMAGAPDWVAQLLLAADSFVFSRPLPGQPNGKSVIAGYPWFGDWGRDTMISLPGLTLATGRQECAARHLTDLRAFCGSWYAAQCLPGSRRKA